MKESDIQKHAVKALRELSKKHNFIFFAPMNETAMMVLKIFKIPESKCLNIIRWLKSMGFLSGVSDFVIFHNGKAYCLELKKPGGRQSKSQITFSKNVRKTGVEYGIAESVDDVIWVLEQWGIM